MRTCIYRRYAPGFHVFVALLQAMFVATCTTKQQNQKLKLF